MLIGIEGDIGSGKTVYAVRCAKIDNDNDKKIFTNLILSDIDYENFDINEFLSNDNNYRDKIKNATVILDEITVYMDCRLSGSKQNLLMGYLVLQSRKRNINIYYTTQSLDLVDFKRLVKYTNIIVYAQEIYIRNNNNEIESLKNYRNYTIADMRKHRDNITQIKMKISPYYKYYDTDQIIEPLVKINAKPKTI